MELTKKDVIDLITVIRVNFDGAYKTTDETDELALINSWYNLLFDYPKEIVLKAFNLTLREAEFAPRIGTIIKAIERLISAQEANDGELWTAIESVLWEVREQLWRVGFTAVEPNGKTQGENAIAKIQEIFDNLPSLCKDYLTQKYRLVNLATADEKTVSIEKACFLKSLPKLRKTRKLKKEYCQGLTSEEKKYLKKS